MKLGFWNGGEAKWTQDLPGCESKFGQHHGAGGEETFCPTKDACKVWLWKTYFRITITTTKDEAVGSEAQGRW